MAAQVAMGENDYRPSLRLVALPAVGASFGGREQRLPASPTLFLRFSAETWNTFGGTDFALFLGGAATALMVNESCESGSACSGETQLAADVVVTAEVGLTLGIPGEPYVVGYFGPAFPAKAERFDPATPRDRKYRRFSWGGGVGGVPRIGDLSFQIEVRFRRDTRFPAHSNDSFEVLFGVPLRSG